MTPLFRRLYNAATMTEAPKAWVVFLSKLISESSDRVQADPLLLKDQDVAAGIRDYIGAQLHSSDSPQILVLDLGGSAYTPLALQELILPLAQRIRGGEYGIMRLVISTSNPGVGNHIRYMAQAHELPLYVSPSPNLWEGHPVGGLTETERGTLDTITAFGGRLTASSLAAIDGIRPSAATNRLVNLDREGYLLRQPRGRREGDFYFEPRSATATPKVFEGPLVIRENTTGPTAVAW